MICVFALGKIYTDKIVSQLLNNLRNHYLFD